MIKKLGLILFSISSLFVVAIGPVQATDLRETILDRTEGIGRESYNTNISGESSLLYFIGQATNIAIGALGVLAVVFIIYAGFLWLTAGGNDDQIKKAKTTIKRVIIGIVIVTLAYAITTFIIGQFREPRLISSIISSIV